VPARPEAAVHVSTFREAPLNVDETERGRVLRAQQGDVEAFSALVEAHWCALVRFARSIVGETDAEDCVQDAFVRAWTKLGGLREPDAFPSWIMRIVARRCFRRGRFLARLLPFAMAPEPVAACATGDLELEQTLSLLAPRQRAVMHLTVVEGFSDSEIARALRITAASVRSHRRKARRTLRAALRVSSSGGGGTE
jgi:RNA polymerase sigma-70 factor (ECF subfamily)